MKTEYAGLDYGLGMSNIDKETGIRYGVISQNEVLQAWADSSEAEYGKPTCPSCGTEEGTLDDENTLLHDVVIFGSSDDVGQDEDWNDGKDYACSRCQETFWSDSVYPDEPYGFTLDDGEYKAESASDGDIFILKSPYYTFAQFCSPCAPGAGYIMNPCEDGPKTYCFGHEWFESEQEGMKTCDRCIEGKRLKTDVPGYDEARFISNGGVILDAEHVECWTCKGTSEIANYVSRAPYPVYRVSDDSLVEEGE